MNRFKFSSVGMKVFVFYVISVLVIISVMGYLSYVKSAEMMKKKIGGVALQTIQQTNKRVNSLLEEYENRSRLVFSNREVQKQLIDDFGDEIERRDNNDRNNSFFSNLINTKNDIQNIYILGELGNAFRYSRYSPYNQGSFVYRRFGNSYLSEAWYKQIREADGRTVFFGIQSSFITLPEEGLLKPVFGFGRAIKNFYNRNEIIGVMLYEADPNEMMNILSEIDFDGSGQTLITDQQLKVIGDPDGSKIGTSLNIEELQGDHGIFNEIIDGKEKLIVFDRFQNLGWWLIGIANTTDFMKDAQDIRWFIFYISIIFALIGFIPAVLIASSVHRPLSLMIRAMRKARDGEFEVRILTQRSDEFGYLFNHFNRMVSHIKDLIDELYVQKLLKQELQLKMMGSQINAHFLYNTLDSIHWISRLHRVDEISTMVFGLSKYLRLSLNEGRDEVRVHEVVELIESYLSIQKVRYQEKFTMNIHVDESLSNYKVIKFIFQPIVENAIYHGLEKKQGKGNLLVKFSQQGNALLFGVTDDGVGIDPEKLFELREMLAGSALHHESNFALRNINTQIKITYGPQYGIEINSNLGEGTCVLLNIPLIK